MSGDNRSAMARAASPSPAAEHAGGLPVARACGFRRLTRRLRIVLLAGGILAPATASAADFTYSTIDFPGAAWTELNGINRPSSRSVPSIIVGSYSDGERLHGFSLTRGVFTAIDFVDADGNQQKDTQTFGVNNLGIIAGTYRQLDPSLHAVIPKAFLLKSGIFGLTPPCPFGDLGLIANGVNNKGDVAATVPINAGTFNPAFKAGFLGQESPCGERDLGVSHNDAWGVNDEGMVVGSYTGTDAADHGFFWKTSTIGFNTLTFDIPQATNTVLRGINNRDQAVGFFDTSNGRFGFVRNKDMSISILTVPGGHRTEVHGINDPDPATGRIEVVGSYVSSDGKRHGFLAVSTISVTSLAQSHCLLEAKRRTLAQDRLTSC